MARFEAKGKILALLSNGEKAEVTTQLSCYGDYKEWWEEPYEPYLGSIKFSEQSEDLDTIEVLYPDEFEPERNDDVKIVEFIKLLDKPNWELEEGSEIYED